jgi:hypothetical protein
LLVVRFDAVNQDNQQQPQVDERKTRELCGAEHDGMRCMRPRCHDNEHEAFNATKLVTWK